MLRWLMRRRIAAFERAYDYDMGYARDMLDASPRALLAFAQASGLAQYRQAVSAEAWHAAKIVATLAEDCGPCTQLVVTMAERDGINPGVLRAILARNEQAMPPDAALGFHFAEALLRHDRRADDLRSEVLRRWGRGGIVSLGFAIAGSRIFPMLKYALGHGHACSRVMVAGVTMPVLPASGVTAM